MVKVEEYKKNNGDTGYNIRLQPTKMRIDDGINGTFITDEVRIKNVPAGKNAKGPYDAFSTYDVFLQIEGYENGVGVQIPEGTGKKLMQEGGLRGRSVDFKKAEVMFEVNGEEKFNSVIVYVLDGKTEEATIKPPLPAHVIEVAKGLLAKGEKTPADVLIFEGHEYPYSSL